MHFVLTPVGSSGDVHPFVGLGQALAARGHRATVLAGAPFQSAVEKAGAEFIETWTTAEYERLTEDPRLWHPTKGLRLVLSAVAAGMREAFGRLVTLHEANSPTFVGHSLALPTRMMAETHGAPVVTIHLAPAAFRSVQLQPAFLPGHHVSWAPAPLQRVLWWLIDRLAIDPPLAAELNAWRAELGLPRVDRVFKDWIHSPNCTVGLFPAWFGPPQPDWPPNTHVTGFPLFDEAGQHVPDARLERFLADGDPPVVFTPGSAHRHARAFFTIATRATARLGVRAVFITKYSDQLEGELPDHVLHVTYAPFSQFLTRCAAVVHHGGIGTCAQGLAAGIPQITMPMGFDQPDNATRLARLGVGRWILPRRFTVSRLTRVLHSVLASNDVARACREYKERIEGEGALDKTCTLIEEQ